MNKTSCKVCNEKKPRIQHTSKTYRDRLYYAYVDSSGSHWKGMVCPDCAKAKARTVAKKRRLELRPAQTKICPQCDKEFTTRSSGQLRCSKECSYQHTLKQLRAKTLVKKIPIRECQQCRKNFESSAPRWYCSEICKDIVKKPRQALKSKEHYLKNRQQKVARACAECGTLHLRRLWCSDACRSKNYNKSPAGKAKLKAFRQKYKKSSRKARKLRQKQAVPKWVKKSELCAIYNACPPGMHVDHIIPLNHPLVCGLHCPDNLQYLTKEENEFKSNQFDGTYENEGWRKFFGGRNTE